MKLLSLLGAVAVASAAIVGIDLGHQYTKAMMVAPGIPFEIIFTDEGKRKDSSTVFVKPALRGDALDDAERIYGSQVGSLCSRFPESCAANLKALLGKSTADEPVAAFTQSHAGLALAADSGRGGAVSVALGAAPNTFTFAPEELAAMSLAQIKERVLKALAHHPQARAIAEDVAVSVSPYADQITRHAYLDALSLANFSSILGLVDEGSAAALGFISGKKLQPEDYNGETVHHLIYDVGSGSTTATLFSYSPFENGTIVLDVESVGYDDSFGGDLLTTYVYNIIYARFLDQFKLKPSFALPPKLASRLRESAEKAKTILSANNDYRVSLESFYNDSDFKTTVTRSEFEDACAELVERASKPISDALANSPTGPKTFDDIASVILNGGATRTPFIQKQLVSLLGSEEKIAKVLNTDEACALGTTMRGYQLKMITGAGDVVMNDRILSDFEVATSGSEQALLFGRGSASSNTTKVILGAPVKDEINIDLFENGNNYGSYTIDKVSKKVQDLKCANVEFVGTFEVTASKIVSLKSVTASCHKEPETVEEAANSTATNTTAKKSRTNVRIPLPAISYTKLRPLNYAEKKEIGARLFQLQAKDQEKIAVEEVKNLLESLCYSLRSYVEDNYESLAKEVSEEELDSAKEKATEIVEWLEYDSDGASLEDIEAHVKDLSEIKHHFERKFKLTDADLSLATLKDTLKQGNEIASQVQEYLMEYGTQISSIREKYGEEEFDFDAENDKIMLKIYGDKKQDEMKLMNHFADFKDALKKLTEVTKLSSKEFSRLSRQELFDAHDAVFSLIYEMMDDMMVLQKQHEERVNFLLVRLEKLRDRKSQKEYKQKLKEQAGQKEQEASEEAAETPVSEGASETSVSEEASETSVSEEPEETVAGEHDEL